MEQVGRFIVGSEKLTKIFGKWPSFHDAEVHEVFLSRDDAETGAKRASTSLIAKIHVREMTSDVDTRGYYVLRNHTLVSLCFFGIGELELQGFNHQNVLLDLEIEPTLDSHGVAKTFRVEFRPSFGLGARFECVTASRFWRQSHVPLRALLGHRTLHLCNLTCREQVKNADRGTRAKVARNGRRYEGKNRFKSARPKSGSAATGTNKGNALNRETTPRKGGGVW